MQFMLRASVAACVVCLGRFGDIPRVPCDMRQWDLDEISSDHIKNGMLRTTEVRAKQQTLDRLASMADMVWFFAPSNGLTQRALTYQIHLGSRLKSGNLVFRAAFNDLKFVI
jgi:hypothetical protein